MLNDRGAFVVLVLTGAMLLAAGLFGVALWG